MEPATACTCPPVDVKCLVRKKKRSLDFVKLQKALGPSNLNWFDDLSAKAAEQRHHDPEPNTPRHLALVNPDSPCFQRQQVELLQAATPGMGSLTPLSAWALLSSQDPNTSTPTSVDRPIIGNRPDLVSPPTVESCLKTCKGISERLGLPTDDTNLSWTNSMATPCLGGDAHTSEQFQEVSTPVPKPKGFPRALFSPEQGRSGSDDFVKELSVTMDEDMLSCGSPLSQVPVTPPVRPDLRKSMMKELFLKSSGHAGEVMAQEDQPVVDQYEKNLEASSSSPVSAVTPGKQSSVVPADLASPVTPRAGGRRFIKRRTMKSSLVRSPLVAEHTTVSTQKEKEHERVVYVDEDIQVKINILRKAASFEGDISAIPGSCLREKAFCSDTEVDIQNRSSSKIQNLRTEDASYSDSNEQQVISSPVLNRKVRKTESKNIQRRKGKTVCTIDSGTHTVVSQVLSDFVDSPSSVQSRRRSPPKKGQKRKSVDTPLPQGDKNGEIYSTPSPMGSQTTTLHSILSSSKKRKIGSGSKRVRFAEKLCQREGELPTVAKKLDYMKSVMNKNNSATSAVCRDRDSDLDKSCEPVSNKEEATSAETQLVLENNWLIERNKTGVDKSVSGTKPKTDNTDGLVPNIPDGEQNLFEPEDVVLAEEKKAKLSNFEVDCSGVCQETSIATRKICSEAVESQDMDVSVSDATEKSSNMSRRALSEHVGSPSPQTVSETELSESAAPADEVRSGSLSNPDKPNNNAPDPYTVSPVRPQPPDEMFTQVSPSSLNEMCLVADSEVALEKKVGTAPSVSQTVLQACHKSGSSHSMTDVQKTVESCDNNKDFAQTKKSVSDTKVEKKENLSADTIPSVQYDKNNSSDSSNGCKPSVLQTMIDTDGSDEKESSSSVPHNSKSISATSVLSVKETLKLLVKSLFTKKPKPKKFFYPTSSQITAVCPKTVFNFKNTECDSNTTASESGPSNSKIITDVGESSDNSKTKENGSNLAGGGNSKATGSLNDGVGVDSKATETLEDTEVSSAAAVEDHKMEGQVQEEQEGGGSLYQAGKKINTQNISLGFMKFSEMFDDNMDDDLVMTTTQSISSSSNEENLSPLIKPKDDSSVATESCDKVHQTTSVIEENVGHENCEKVSDWIPNSQDVHNMVRDVQEELFSDIEFSQVDPNNPLPQDSTANEETSGGKDGAGNALESSKESSLTVTVFSSKEDIKLLNPADLLNKETGNTDASDTSQITSERDKSKSSSSKQDIHVFKMPDVPDKGSIQKVQVLSDSDTDVLLSDMDLSGPTKDSDKSDLSKIPSHSEGSDAHSSDFETCVSEQESSKCVKGSKSVVSSSVSDSDTDEYVTSTEEVKEVSPEGKQVNVRSKITTRSRSSRKNSVLLSRSQMMSDSDSDINPVGNRKLKKGKAVSNYHPAVMRQESPVVVSESNPLVVWSDLESCDTLQGLDVVSDGFHISDTEMILKEKDEVCSLKTENAVESLEVPVQDVKTEPEMNEQMSPCTSSCMKASTKDNGQTVTSTEKTSRPCSVSDWSDLESGEADEAEEEVTFAASTRNVEQQLQLVAVKDEVQTKTSVLDLQEEPSNREQDGNLSMKGTKITVNSGELSLQNTDFPPESKFKANFTSDREVDKENDIRTDGGKLEIQQLSKTSHSVEPELPLIVSRKSFMPEFSGFSTAGGTKINLDVNSLQKASCLFEAIDKLDDNSHSTGNAESSNPKITGFSTASGNNVDLDEGSLQRATSLLENEGDVTRCNIPRGNTELSYQKFTGFSTASGKNVDLDEESLQRATSLFENEGDVTRCNIPRGNTESSNQKFTGFSTASGKNVDLDPKSFQKAIALLENEKDFSDVSCCNFSKGNAESSDQKFTGFSTASGKHVDLDAKSLQKATSLLENDMEGTPSRKTDLKVSFSGHGLSSRRKKTCINISEVTASCLKDPGPSGFPSFSTASGKNLALHEDSLKKAQTMMISVNDTLTDKGRKPLTDQTSDHVQSDTNDHFSMIKNIPSSSEAAELESFLDDLLKSKKCLEKNSKQAQEKSAFSCIPSKSLDGFKLSSNQSNDNIEEMFSAKYDKALSGFKSSSLAGFSSVGKKSMQSVSNKSKMKGDPMLKPKGFRPFKKPRIVQKPKSFESEETGVGESPEASALEGGPVCSAGRLGTVVAFPVPDHLKTDSVTSKISGFQLRAVIGSSEQLQPCQTSRQRPDVGAPDSVKSDSDMTEMLLLEFSRDMMELSQAAVVGWNDTGTVAVSQSVDIKHDIKQETGTGCSSLDCSKPLRDKYNTSKSACKDSSNAQKEKKELPALSNTSEESCKSTMREQTNVSTDGGSDGHLKLIDVLFEGDMSSQLDVKPNITTPKPCTDFSQDQQMKMDIGDGRRNTVDSASATNRNKSKIISRDCAEKVRRTMQSVGSSHDSVGGMFQTASGKDISVSDKSLEYSEKLWNDASQDGSMNNDHASGSEGEGASGSVEKDVRIHQDQTDHAVPSAEPFVKLDTVPIDDDRKTETAEGKENILGQKVDVVLRSGSNLFQTASGKAVSVMEKSLSEAQKLWDNGNQVIAVSSSPFQTASGKSVSVSETSLKEAGSVILEEKNQNLIGTEFRAFQTVQSVKSVAKAKNMLKSVDEEILTTVSSSSSVQTVSGIAVTESADALAKSKNLYESECSTVEPSSKLREASIATVKVSAQAERLFADKECASSLFQTASGSSVTISSKALNEARKLWNEDQPTATSSIVPRATGFSVSISDQEEQMSTTSTSMSKTSAASLFQTASGASVTVSAKALAKGKKLWADDCEQMEMLSSLFQTASGAPDNALIPGQELWDKVPNTSLFQTASGASVNVSAKALAHGKKLLAYENDQPTKAPSTSLFQTASGASVNVSAKALAHGKKLWANENDQPTKAPSSSLFQTASGASVNVSAKALAHGKKLLADENDQPTKAPSTSLFQTASGASVNVSAKALAHGKKLWANENDQPAKAPSTSLFQTASGASVNVSAKAFAHGKKLLADENDQPAKAPSTSLFQTASGASVNVSAKALAQGKKLLADENDQESKSPSSSLFQTASGASVNASAKALAHGKKLWANENDQPAKAPSTSLFQTASGASVNVSAKAFAHGKNLLADENDQESKSPSTNLFQTASGASVNVSAKALAQGKKLLTDEKAQEIKSPCPSHYQTASGTSVSVSSSSLEKGKRLLAETSTHSASGRTRSASESSFVDCLKLADVSVDSVVDEAVVPQCLGADRSPKTSCEQNSRMSEGTDKLDQGSHGNSPRTPLISTPEAVYQDHSGRDGRRFPPLRSTSLTPVRRSEEYTLEAVTSKAGLSTPHATSSSFKTPYKNTAFVTPIRQPDIQQKQPQSKGKTPVFYPRASLRTSRNHGRVSPANQNVPRAMLPKDNSGELSSSNQTESVSGMNSPRSISHIGRRVITTSEKSGRFSPSFVNSEKKSKNVSVSNDLVTTKVSQQDDRYNCSEHRDRLDSGEIKGVVKDMKLTHQSVMSEPYKGKGNVLKTGNEPLTSSAKINQSHLEDARRKQEEIIQCKKKQKIRPCCGRLLSEKSSGQKKLQYRDLEIGTHNCELWSSGVRPETCDISCSNAEEFRFRMTDFYPQLASSVLVGDGAELIPDNSGFAGKEEFYRSFLTLEGVDPRLTTDLWVFNHYRWIVWKMAAYEVALPTQFGGRCLTPNIIMLQLKYRYDREVDRCHRSALKKIVERDDAACKRMVLCVAGIKNCPGPSGENKAAAGKFLEVTDGWYCVKAKLDVGLTELVEKKKICVGDKICVSGGELAGSQDACTPLEIPDCLYLKICMNSTRPAPWDCKLGYQRDPRPLCVPISSLHAEGGVVGCVDAVVTRLYPLMYMEKLPEGGSVFRTEDEEERVQRQFDRQKQVKMEKLYAELQSGLEQDHGKGRRKSRKRWTQGEVEDLQTGQEIYEAVEGCLQPEELHSWLSPYQRQQMEDHQRRLLEQQQQQLQDKFHRAWEDTQQGQTSRSVTPVLKLRLSGCAKRDIDAQASPIVTVWRPTAEWLGLQEGKRYKMFGLSAAPARTRLESHSVHLTATRQTRLQHLPVDENYLDLVYEPREVWRVRDLRTRSPAHKEFDFVGIVVRHHNDSQRNCDTVIVADVDGDTLGIRFWGRMQSFGVEDQMSEGKCVVAVNLILKGTHGTVMADACHEVSRFSSSSKHPDHGKSLARFTSMSKTEKVQFVEAVKSHLSNHGNQKSAPPTHLTTTPEKFFSELPSECLQRLFSPMEEASGTKGENSATPDPAIKKRRAALRERSSKLMAYGSPKPLSPLPVQISPAVGKAFKLPFSQATNMNDSFS